MNDEEIERANRLMILFDNIPYIKVEPNKKYDWKPEEASKYWSDRK